MIHQRDPERDVDPEQEWDDGPSKSSLKREMHALQALGEQLVELSSERLAKVPMPENLATAVREARRITQRGARKRQMQYIGRLMRSVDPEPIQAQLDIFNGVSKAEVARQHRLERLRERLLKDEQSLGEIAETWPDADLQQLRTLRRNALKERELSKPPRAYREIFRMLRDLDAAATTVDGDQADDSDDDNFPSVERT